MKGEDGRSLRVALVSDAILNATAGSAADRLRAGLDEQGWGIVALPPSDLAEDPARAWIANIADLTAEFTRHGLDAVVLFAAAEPRARRRLILDALATESSVPAAHGDADAPAAIDGILEDLRRRSAEHTARPESWVAAARTTA